MSKKRRNVIEVNFLGNNAEDVTGSMTLITFGDKKILLEAGLYQSTAIDKDYKVNSRSFREFKPKEIDYIFIAHIHADHALLLPRLYKEGCKAQIIIPAGSKSLLALMSKDSAHIMSKDAAYLSKVSGKKIDPIYTDADISNMLSYIWEFEMKKDIQLDKTLGFKFIPSGHIIFAAQLILKIRIGNLIKKILYTSDLGNISIPKMYTDSFNEAKGFFDLVIGESTYGHELRHIKKKDKQKDLEKLKTIITETIEKNGKVLIPIFSLDRAQQMATEIYLLFHDNPDFKTKVIVDSPLACKVFKQYLVDLPQDQREVLEAVTKWENLHFVKDYNKSQELQRTNEPMVVLAAPGFISKGRSLGWTEALIEDANNFIVTCGYFPPTSVIAKIKKGEQRRVKIGNKYYKNNVKIYSLLGFSSHAQRKDLINYYSKLNTNQLVLVHGSKESKISLCNELNEINEQSLGKTKILISQKNMKIQIK